jgi:hypothetical protein
MIRSKTHAAPEGHTAAATEASTTSPGSHPPADTAAGCHDRARSDHEAAAGMDTENGRLRMEKSARSWTERATLLEGEDEVSYRAVLKAEWEAGEKPAPIPTRRPDPARDSAQGGTGRRS